jgi:hypothetical protein
LYGSAAVAANDGDVPAAQRIKQSSAAEITLLRLKFKQISSFKEILETQRVSAQKQTTGYRSDTLPYPLSIPPGEARVLPGGAKKAPPGKMPERAQENICLYMEEVGFVSKGPVRIKPG